MWKEFLILKTNQAIYIICFCKIRLQSATFFSCTGKLRYQSQHFRIDAGRSGILFKGRTYQPCSYLYRWWTGYSCQQSQVRYPYYKCILPYTDNRSTHYSGLRYRISLIRYRKMKRLESRNEFSKRFLLKRIGRILNFTFSTGIIIGIIFIGGFYKRTKSTVVLILKSYGWYRQKKKDNYKSL